MDASRFADDLEDLPSHELEDQLLALNAHITAAVYRFLMLVRALDARMAWAEVGMRSMAHWLNWPTGGNGIAVLISARHANRCA